MTATYTAGIPRYDELVEFIDKQKTCIQDLEAIVDFCNEAAGVGAQEVIRDAHDIMHVLLGGDRTRAWCWMSDWLDLYTPRNCTQAWPDVRIRMTEVFKKAGGKRCNGGERVTHEVPLGPERKRNR